MRKIPELYKKRNETLKRKRIAKKKNYEPSEETAKFKKTKNKTQCPNL